jgi:hypothetical protein
MIAIAYRFGKEGDALFGCEQRCRRVGHADDELVEEDRCAVSDIKVAIRDGIETAGVYSRRHACTVTYPAERLGTKWASSQ